jgi:hypothetical protein
MKVRLTITDDSVKKYESKEGTYFIAYQIFEIFNKKLELFDKRVKTNRWLEFKTTGTRSSGAGELYPDGYHLYLQEVNNVKCRKIYYKEPVAYGYIDETPAVVARRIFI